MDTIKSLFSPKKSYDLRTVPPTFQGYSRLSDSVLASIPNDTLEFDEEDYEFVDLLGLGCRNGRGDIADPVVGFIVVEFGHTRTIHRMHMSDIPRSSKTLIDTANKPINLRSIWFKDLSKFQLMSYLAFADALNNGFSIFDHLKTFDDIIKHGITATVMRDKMVEAEICRALSKMNTSGMKVVISEQIMATVKNKKSEFWSELVKLDAKTFKEVSPDLPYQVPKPSNAIHHIPPSLTPLTPLIQSVSSNNSASRRQHTNSPLQGQLMQIQKGIQGPEEDEEVFQHSVNKMPFRDPVLPIPVSDLKRKPEWNFAAMGKAKKVKVEGF